MAAQMIPVSFHEAMSLPAMQVPADSIKFGSCAMESDKFISVCGGGNVTIIDLSNNNEVTRRPISAEAAIMNPVAKVIALRSQSQLQIFNLELRTKMKAHAMTEAVKFWRWVNNNTIAIVTPTAVYHWSLEGDASPTKVFDRHAQLAEGKQVIGYEVSADGKWCLLVGISQGAGGIEGTMQLYSAAKRVSQVLQGHTGCFHTIKVPGREDPAQVLCFEEKKPQQPAKLFVMEVGRDPSLPGEAFRLTPQAIPVPAEAQADFPVSMVASKAQDIIYMITKMGFLYLFDVHSGKAIYRARISTETIFVTAYNESTGGVFGITARSGQVLQVTINQQTLIPYISSTLRDNQLAISLAGRLNLPGADDLYTAEFNRLLSVNDVAGAAKLAANSPQGILRTPNTVNTFKNIPAQPGAPAPVFQYFSVLLEHSKLNALESLELARPVLAQGRPQLIEKWLTEDKLECSEELGDLIMPVDSNIALSVYLRAQVPEKAINCFLQRGEFNKIVAYARQVNFQCDYSYMLQNLVRSNPDGAVEFAKQLTGGEGGPLLDINTVVDIFMQFNLIQACTAVLLEALKGDKQEEGYLQTKLFEINLGTGQPQFVQVADAMLQNEMFHHYDRARVAQLCEQCGLLQRALEHYSEPADIKRILSNAAGLNAEFVMSFFGSLSPDVSLDCLNHMLATNIRVNLNLVVQIAQKYVEQLGAEPLIEMLEKFKSWEGIYYFLGAVVNFSQDALVHFKYIESAAKMGQFNEVERVCRDSTVYDPQQVKDFLMNAKLGDPRPLIHVCDRHDFVDEMTAYLHANNLTKYIEVYVQKVSPAKTPAVIGKLLDLDSNEDFVRNLLNLVGPACPVDELVEQVERRNRLRILQPWLEARIATGNTEAATHNAIGKIYIQLNRDPNSFLENNQFYEPSVLGKFSEKLDPSLAVIAYRRANGACDDDLIRVCYDQGLFKALARYLVERQDLDLWERVLPQEDGEESPSRRALIDQVVQSALPETQNPDEVSTTVKAFMNAEMPHELIELLERLVLQGSEFSDNRNLQNLLVLTAIRADKAKVMDLINRLDNLDGPAVAEIALQDEYQLFEEAFVIYNKSAKNAQSEEEKARMYVLAVSVLLDKMSELERAKEFAERVSEKDVWSKLAESQLAENMVHEAISSYVKADDATNYTAVIGAAHTEENYGDLVIYLKMARNHVKEALVDTEYIYALAKESALGDLEEFISAPNIANIQNIGERCFDEGMYEAAKLLFSNINNNAKLALCYVHMSQYREAVDAATRANSISTWKEVNSYCIKAGEFRLAAICGLHIIVQPDHLDELVNHYERAGHPAELMQLLEQGLGQDNAHTGMFTELGVLYSKYAPEKLMEHVKIFHNRINKIKLLKACETALLWDEAVYLYQQDNQHDSAVKVMIEHSVAWNNDLFLDCVQKVRNQEVAYKAIGFYLEEHPIDLERLLQVLTPTLDPARVVHQLKRAEGMQLGVKYLKMVQKENITTVNEALHELYIEEEDFENLRTSVDEYDAFDQIKLAQEVESHELLEFRRIAAHLFKRNGRWRASVDLSKQDKMFKDAIDTAAESKDAELVDDLLRYFVDSKDKTSFCAVLYTCFDFVKPDTAMELGWRYGLMDYTMPYAIQYMSNLHERIADLEKRTEKKEEGEEQEQAAAAAAMIGGGMMGNGPLMLTNQAYVPDASGYGMGGGMPGQGMGVPAQGMGMGMPQQNMGGVGMGMGMGMGGGY
uniref:Clathrin heavy chain n=1 Tax=Phaeomonas parva TaxID=124430 RepID=A0A7S1XLU7_9STRA|mmetsp:Transcript_1604/g.4434  ORF Transcript_1604/g.4434 Transcript_1604/m.4434 type:complete len:1727 (+) Transcript_1604:223-5403(+)|eukprot:CAMPEP_0118864420 /NCGR_PEP_ID=MMETSP1163-20130328/9004_1 /TAXON_ID=124430 /ORGANISM="Phaeomonas parva, Strain CCMP2877" /LENGTH=1726 /DNA_ID=CAMNT_0006798543 /DNA_START=183 /DNA_END=5363 /DNA_ORIENTATION=-